MRTAVHPGNFDPVTLGYYDIVEHIAEMVNELIVEVLNNKAKRPLFSAQECVNMLEEVTASLPNAEIQSSEGLLIDFARGNHAGIVAGGLWAITDSEYELRVTQTNRVIAPGTNTISLTTNLKYSYLSSNIVKETAEYGGDISGFLHPIITAKVREELEEKRQLI